MHSSSKTVILGILHHLAAHNAFFQYDSCTGNPPSSRRAQCTFPVRQLYWESTLILQRTMHSSSKTVILGIHRHLAAHNALFQYDSYTGNPASPRSAQCTLPVRHTGICRTSHSARCTPLVRQFYQDSYDIAQRIMCSSIQTVKPGINADTQRTMHSSSKTVLAREYIIVFYYSLVLA